MRLAIIALAMGLVPTLACAQDPAAGEKLFVQCKACHQIGSSAKHAVGPELNGVVGRKAGTVEGYSFSPAMKGSGLTWDEASLKEFVKDPRAKVAGTKMTYAGLKDDKKADDVIAYLKQFKADGQKAE
jgi:cytochrome c